MQHRFDAFRSNMASSVQLAHAHRAQEVFPDQGILEGIGTAMAVAAGGQSVIGGQLTLVQQLFMRGIHIGMDGSVLQAGSSVYAPGENRGAKLWKIDLWHNIIDGVPLCQAECLESRWGFGADFFARELFNANRGFVASKIRCMQSLVRARRARHIQHLLTEKMFKLILLIVRKYRTYG